ncbi:hypothetical protein [uncultured phage]|nr:hypothetical protein [uncultured phage]
MTDKFNPEDKSLQPIGRLLERAEVTADDIQKAIDDWKKKPPDDEFKNLLEPEINYG